jgi:O-antigen ligase
VALLCAMAALTVGLAATESRGGAIAAIVAAFAALVVFRHRFVIVLVMIAFAVGAGLAFASTEPGALKRITNVSDGGSGRSDLWRVAWRMTEDHPLVGVGLGNFPAQSPLYVREPGELVAVGQIVETKQRTHNTYLEMLSETGIVGLLLFLLVLGSALGAATVAVRRLQAAGERVAADLIRGVLVASLAALAASAFLSNGSDKRLWLLLALGPGVLAATELQRRGGRTR